MPVMFRHLTGTDVNHTDSGGAYWATGRSGGAMLYSCAPWVISLAKCGPDLSQFEPSWGGA